MSKIVRDVTSQNHRWFVPLRNRSAHEHLPWANIENSQFTLFGVCDNNKMGRTRTRMYVIITVYMYKFCLIRMIASLTDVVSGASILVEY